MHPWERRLADLAHLLGACHATYMEPNLFRMNSNQFLQTSRTVTFIIQKNKGSIPGFDDWYGKEILVPWSRDPVMSWAKESRNAIEKEGDLELHSTLNCTLIASYLAGEDAKIHLGRAELLDAGVKKLVRFARRHLATGISDAAVIKVERRWVTASLDTWELLHALTYVYSRTHEACRSLSSKLGATMHTQITDPAEFERFRDNAQRAEYFKLTNLRPHSIAVTTQAIHRDDKQHLPKGLQEIIESASHENRSDRTIDSTSQFLTRMAESTFTHFGNHVPMLFLYDDTWNIVDMISTQFSDQAEKYIFWRRMAERVATRRAYGIGWVSESWLRDATSYPSTAVRNLPITGEHLHALVSDKAGNIRNVVWEISRSSPDGAASLRRLPDSSKFNFTPNYLAPIRRVWGLSDGTAL